MKLSTLHAMGLAWAQTWGDEVLQTGFYHDLVVNPLTGEYLLSDEFTRNVVTGLALLRGEISRKTYDRLMATGSFRENMLLQVRGGR